ncbi:MAG: ATP-binding cassette domain-containing protein [Pirellulales bacterium]
MIRCERATVQRTGRVVVEAVSLEVASGRAVALIGRGGSGKTALLAAAATALPLHAGDIVVEGRSVRREADAVRRLIGYAPARLPAWPGLRADEFLELCGVAAGLRGAPLAAAVDKGLALAGLGSAGHADLESLPAGPAKRLLLARAVLHDPQVLLLDDPLGSLDPVERRDIERLIGDLHLMGRTVLAAIDDAAVPDCFTHVAVLDEGRLVAHGPAEPAAFAGGRRWRCSLVCRGAAERAATVVGRVAGPCRVDELDRVAFELDPAGPSLGKVVVAVEQAGIAVESAGFDPPWTAQLIR